MAILEFGLVWKLYEKYLQYLNLILHLLPEPWWESTPYQTLYKYSEYV